MAESVESVVGIDTTEIDTPVDLLERLRDGVLPETWQATLGRPDPTAVLVAMWTARLARVVTARYAAMLRVHDLQYSDFAALTLVCLIGPTSPGSMQDYLVITSGGMTKTIDRLVDRDLAERRPDPDDGRGVLVAPTPAGERVQAELFATDVERHAAGLETMTVAERGQLVTSLRGLLDILERE